MDELAHNDLFSYDSSPRQYNRVVSEWGRAEVEHSTRNSGHFGDESQSLALVLTLLFILVRYARWQHCGCSMECVYGKHQLPNDQ